MTAAEWAERYPRAVLDEAQKAPSIIEIVKAVHDAHPKTRYVLSGSSQILLLSRTRETLAGRVSIDEMWPLTLPELATNDWSDPIAESRLVRWLRDSRQADVLLGVPAADETFGRARARLDHYLRWGGMPVLADADAGDDDERKRWLLDYRRTYLERDVADLASLRDLEPFVRAQEAVAHRAGSLVNFSDLARTAGVSQPTAQRFLRYLELSYQVIVLPAYHRNPDKRLAKQPKVLMTDPGIHRSTIGHWGPLDGGAYEAAISSEILKQVGNAGLSSKPHHMRTLDGREVDLVLELEEGFVAIEIKKTRNVADADARHLRELDDLLDKPILGLFLLSEDTTIRKLSGGVLAMPSAWALG